jgi:Uma2 family endonuclease
MESARRIRWTADEYLAREQRSADRHEFLDGEIYAMAGATLRHNTIAANAIYLITGLLRGKPCRTFTSDQRIHVAATGLYTYADAGVVCGDAKMHPSDPLTLLNPTLLVEVFSPSTESYDRGEKLQHYREIPSLREVLHVSTRERLVMHHRRIDTGQWVLTERRDGEMDLPVLSGVVRLDDLYDKVDFDRPDA